VSALLPPNAFVALLRQEGATRYHDKHPFHLKMHAGDLSKRQLRGWVLNRYYYQTRIPIKDAIVVSKSEDPSFRRSWLRRIVDHDGLSPSEGGLAQWVRLAEGVGIDQSELLSMRHVLPGARFACDAYVSLVRERTLVEAVASSLTEFFSPEIMTDRIRAWEVHYPWVDTRVLEYFRGRISRARADSQQAIDFVVSHATTPDLQAGCVDALIAKCQILWALLDAVSAAFPDEPRP
jgi:pyrroloquinoline-quinone synthase